MRGELSVIAFPLLHALSVMLQIITDTFSPFPDFASFGQKSSIWVSRQLPLLVTGGSLLSFESSGPCTVLYDGNPRA